MYTHTEFEVRSTSPSEFDNIMVTTPCMISVYNCGCSAMLLAKHIHTDLHCDVILLLLRYP